MYGQSVECEAFYTWILDKFGVEIGLWLENKEIAWWACEHKLRSSLEVSARVWIWTS